MIRLSQTDKLDGILSWSLVARDTCPGAVDKDGALVPACRGCYAVDGNYRFDNVISARQENREDWKRAAWADEMVFRLDNSRYFRWFDSGDVYCVELATKMLEVMRRTPWCHHWLPTRSYKFAKLRKVLEQMHALPNVVVRYSSDSVLGGFVPGVHGSTILPPELPTPDGVQRCQAPANANRCNGCRACWDKNVPVIGYVAHGQAMKKVIRITRETVDVG